MKNMKIFIEVPQKLVTNKLILEVISYSTKQPFCFHVHKLV